MIQDSDGRSDNSHDTNHRNELISATVADTSKYSEPRSAGLSNKSFFSINKEHSEALANISVEPENLPKDPFDYEKILVLWDKMTEIIDLKGNFIQSALLKKWKPYSVFENKVLVKVPSMTVEHKIRESIEPLLAEQKKYLNNYALEFVFEVEEVIDDVSDEKKIPQHFKDFNKLITIYPEVDKMRELFGLYPTEI